MPRSAGPTDRPSRQPLSCLDYAVGAEALPQRSGRRGGAGRPHGGDGGGARLARRQREGHALPRMGARADRRRRRGARRIRERASRCSRPDRDRRKPGRSTSTCNRGDPRPRRLTDEAHAACSTNDRRLDARRARSSGFPSCIADARCCAVTPGRNEWEIALRSAPRARLAERQHAAALAARARRRDCVARPVAARAGRDERPPRRSGRHSGAPAAIDSPTSRPGDFRGRDADGRPRARDSGKQAGFRHHAPRLAHAARPGRRLRRPGGAAPFPLERGGAGQGPDPPAGRSAPR